MDNSEFANKKFFIYTVFLWSMTLAGFALHFAFDSKPIPWIPVLVIGCGVVILEHLSIGSSDSLDLNNASMLLLAGIIICDSHYYRAPFAAMIPAFFGFYFPTLREKKYLTFFANAGFVAAPLLPTIGIYLGVTRLFPDSTAVTFLALALAAVVFEAGNFAGYNGFLWFRDGERFDIKYLPPDYVIQVVAFSFVGGMLGLLTVEVGPSIIPLAVVPVAVGHYVMTTSVRFTHRMDGITNILNRVLQAKDPYTRDHVERVAHYAKVMGAQLGLEEDRITSLGHAAMFHDLGKIIIPNLILNKPGRLTEEEFAVMKTHEHVTVEMLRSIEMLAPIASTVSGDFAFYNRAKTHEPIEPFIVVVADAYDAMTSTRAYRKALDTEEAQRRLVESAGTQFHPKVVTALLSAFLNDPSLNMAGTDAEHHPDAPENADITSAGVGDIDLEKARANHPTALPVAPIDGPDPSNPTLAESGG